MWTEIGGMGLFTLLAAVILKIQHNTISKKADGALTAQRFKEVESSLARGDEKFNKIEKKLDKYQEEQIKQGKILTEVHTIVKRMEKNGIK